jgi:hypothetical protein
VVVPLRSGQGVMIGVARGNMRVLTKIAAR